jgi:uncharacterized protein involved in outer membrane biogenesis
MYSPILQHIFKGKTRPFNKTRQSYLEINIDNIELPEYFAYLPLAASMDIRSGELNITMNLAYAVEETGAPTLSIDGTMTLSRLEVVDKKGSPLVKLTALSIDIASSNLLAKNININNISIRSPEIYIQRDNTGQLNFLKLIPRNESQSSQKEAEKKSQTDSEEPFKFTLAQAELTGGKIVYTDQSLTIPFASTIESLNITLSQLSNEKDHEADFTLAATTDADEKVELSGNLTLTPLKIKGAITASDFPIHRYKPYYNDFILFDITDGTAYLTSEFLYDSTLTGPGVIISDLTFSLNSIKLTTLQEGEEFLHIPRLSLKNCSFDSLQKEIQVGQFSTEKASFFVKRTEDGKINVLNLVPPSSDEAKASEKRSDEKSEKQAVETKENKQGEHPNTQSDNKQDPDSQRPWRIKVNEALLKGYSLKVQDMQGPVQTLFTVGDMNVEAKEFIFESSHPDPLMNLPHLSLSLNSLKLHSQKTNEDIVSIGSISLNECSFNLQKQALTIQEFSTEKGAVFLKKADNGILNVRNLAPLHSEEKDRSPVDKAMEKENSSAKEMPKTQKPWHVQVNKALLKEYTVKAEDLEAPEQPVFTVDDINLDAREFTFETSELSPVVDLAHLSVSLDTLKLMSQKTNEDIIRIGALSLDESSFNLQKQTITIGEFSTENGYLFLTRTKEGQINLLNLASSPKQKEQTGTEKSRENESPTIETSPPGTQRPWHIEVNKASLKGYSVRAEDRQSPELPRTTIDSINLDARDFIFESSQKKPLISVPNLSLSLETVKVLSQKSNEDIISIGTISASKCSYDSQKNAFWIGEFTTEKGSFILKKTEEGVFNIRNLAAPSAIGQKISDEMQPQKKEESGKEKAEESEPDNQKSFQLEVDKALLKGYTITAEDMQNPEMTLLKVNDINLAVKDFTFESSPVQPFVDIPDLSLSLNSITLQSQKSNEDVVSIGDIALNKCSFNLTDQSVTIGEFTTKDGSLLLRRTEQGALNIQNLIASPPKEEPAGMASSEITETDQTDAETDAEKVTPWQIKVNKALLQKYKIKAEDLQSPAMTLLTVDNINVDAKEFTFQSAQTEPLMNLSQLAFSLEALTLRNQKKKEDVLKVPHFEINKFSFNSSQQEIKIGQVMSEKGFLLVRVNPKGELNFQNLTPPPSSSEQKETKQKPKETDKGNPWHVKVDKALLKGYTIKAEDLQRREPAFFTFDRINFEASKFSTDRDKKFNTSLSFRLNDKGNLALKGLTAINPFALDGQIDINDIDIQGLKPYYADIINLIVEDGYFHTSGKLSFQTVAESEPKINYHGKLSVTDFASIDPVTKQDFLKWKSLDFIDFSFGYSPLNLLIEQIDIDDFYSLFIINKDGTINFKNIMAKNNQESEKKGGREEEKKKDTSSDIFVKKVVLQRGNISFTDRSIEPTFSAELLEVGGNITGLSSHEKTKADVNLTGRTDDYAPLEIVGTINPIAKPLNADINLSFKGIGLSPFTPYSGKYLGYTVQKGKLTLNLKYEISNDKLNAKNHLLFDQLTLGEKVDSSEAVSLPLKFAIALLKDRNGVIDLNVPLKGDLSDPNFKVGQVIVQALKNLITRVVTSPYSFIKGIIEGGEELNYIEFDYGSAELTKEDKEKLDKIINALYNRPSLKLEIAGYVDKEKDLKRLRDKKFENLLKTEKIIDMVINKGKDVGSVDEITIEPGEYDKYLIKAYEGADFPKEKNAMGLIKELPPKEMEKLLYDHIEVTGDDLKRLARERAMVVKKYILKSGKVEPERVFIVLPSSSSSEEIDQNVKKSRVVFTLLP